MSGKSNRKSFLNKFSILDNKLRDVTNSFVSGDKDLVVNRKGSINNERFKQVQRNLEILSNTTKGIK